VKERQQFGTGKSWHLKTDDFRKKDHEKIYGSTISGVPDGGFCGVQTPSPEIPNFC
jgi:hypothetical protein